MSRYTIGIDIGTTGTKVVLLDVARGIVAQSSHETELHSPQPGFAEADPRQWLDNAVAGIQEVLATAQASPRDISALAASGMVPAVIPLGSEDEPLRRAILQNDARATEEIARIADELADLDLVAITGSPLSQQSVAPTAGWLAAREPALWARTTHLVGSYDWILIAFGADPHVERNWAIESGLFTLDGGPVDRVFRAAGLGHEIIPPVLDPGDRAGSLSQEMAARTGLIAGTPLIVGGADHVLSAFAAGVQDSGDWLVKLGGAGDILVAADHPVTDRRLYLDAHPIPGRWLPNGCMATSGSLIRWYQGLIGGAPLTALDLEAAERPAADLLCLPYFLGEKSPLHDPDLRGSFAGLHLGHTRADLYRAVLEAIAFGFRHHAEVFAEIGIPRRRVLITNGGSRSTLWKQIHSEVLGTEVYPVVDHPGASLGAALIAAIGAGALPDWDAASRFLTLGEPVVPDPERVRAYADSYPEWRRLGDATTPVSHYLARRTRT